MTPAQLERIEEIFYAALDQDSGDVAQFLETACKGDELLRRKVEALLASRQRAGSFIETSAAGIATRIIGNGQTDLLVGQTFGHYKISKRIGSGGMGEVYLAADMTAGRKAALKLLPARFTGDAERLKRFQQEAHAVVALNHPNILTVYEIGEDHSTHYIASELIEGETLRQRLMRGQMELGEAVDVAIQVASALAAAHEAGIVHRDINPANIMLRSDGYVKVLDFGIAKLAEQEAAATMPKDEALLLVETNLGLILGTVHYMSPEQASGAPVDKRTDIWSLGAVLYEMVTRHAPFIGDTPREVMTSILEKEPSPLASYVRHSPAELQQIISRTLRKDRKERYQSAGEMLQALKNLRHKLELKAELERSRTPSWLRWARSPIALVLAFLVFAVALALPFYRHRNLATTLPPEKSIAVLPFSNLSKEEENAFFADGVQNEILTDLARIADLKVISRASTMQYKSGVARNLHKIGQQLGVAHVVEGSVQRVGNRVRVNAQLIDARTDRHLWGETYDRNLSDVFAIQSEIAKAIADQLQAKLSQSEKSEIERPPTVDLTAFDLYARAQNLLLTNLSSITRTKLLQAADLLNQAVTRDPSFFQAYCQLAHTHGLLYSLGFDHTPGRLALAETAVQAAFRLRPDAGEAHLARAETLYRGYLDYDGALGELEIAGQTVPNNPQLFTLKGYIQRRQGRWEESTRNLERAIDLDPRYTDMLLQIALSYGVLRRYAEDISVLERALAIEPNDINTKVAIAAVQFHWKGDTRPLHQTIDSIRAANPGALPNVANDWLSCALAERDLAAATSALNALGEIPLTDYVVHINRPLIEGVLARMTKDEGKARAAFTSARALQEKAIQAQPNYGPALCVLGLIDAALGRKEEALREGRRAVELLSAKKDALTGPLMIEYLAMIAAWAGDKDLACEQLAIAVRPPSTVSYGQLKLLPFWDPLRGDPRFEQIVASLAPKSLAAPTSLRPEKSIAVLPLENLSDEKENAFLADGIQDELLSNLSKIADLKVISRTSVMQYKSGIKRNLKEIAQQLGVGHLVEGNVRRAGNRVRVSVQLIDARTDTHVWAEHYDRDVADVFAIESEIAASIAEQLGAHLSVREKAAIAKAPTRDVVANDLYVRAKELEAAAEADPGGKESLLKAVHLLEEAVARDPGFVLAYCLICRVHLDIYWIGFDHTPGRRELANVALQNATRLQPDADEVHVARAIYAYHGFRDYDRARAELDLARSTLPNNAEIYWYTASIDRRQGQWNEAIRIFERAIELDPRNYSIIVEAAFTHSTLRRFARSRQLLERALWVSPGDHFVRAELARLDFLERGELDSWHNQLSAIVAEGPAEASHVALQLVLCALAAHDREAAAHALTFIPPEGLIEPRGNVLFPREWLVGLVAWSFGDKAAAQTAFSAARPILERVTVDQPEYAPAWSLLGIIDAALGRKENAIREGRHACDLIPISKDSSEGPCWVTNLATIYAWTGDNDAALQQLGNSARNFGVTYGELKLFPIWNSLRSDPRFDQILASLAPK
ncbi:MAG TPA: protein kinase [Verrucomicrobiae bacterium]|nr:protein kinase [Verrucomicrobiae bacterium]